MSAPPRPPRGGGDHQTVRTVSVAAIAVIAAVAALSAASAIAIPTALAALVALALAPLVARLQRLGAPAALAAALVVFGLAAGLGAGLYALAPSFEEFRRNAPAMIRSVERELRDVGEEVAEEVAETTDAPPPAGAEGDEDAPDAGERIVQTGRRLLTDVAMATPGLMAGGVYALFLTFFILAERRLLWRAMVAAARSGPGRLRIARAVRDVRRDVSVYLLSITIINVLLGAATAAIFWGLGLPSPALLGAGMTALNYMPYIGPTIMNVVVFGVALIEFGSPQQALLPCAALLALNTLEGQIVTPWIVGDRVRVSVLAIFAAVAFGAWLWGAAGALAATPALIVGRALWLRSRARPARDLPLAGEKDADRERRERRVSGRRRA